MVNNDLCFKTKEGEEYYNYLDSLEGGKFVTVFISEWVGIVADLKEKCKPVKVRPMRNSSSSVVLTKVVHYEEVYSR